jgi:hypothetical protein
MFNQKQPKFCLLSRNLSNKLCNTIGIEELFNKDTELSLYPNPTNNMLNLSFKLERNANIDITLFDYTGKEVHHVSKGKQYIGKHLINIDVSSYSSGFYFVRVQVQNRVETLKLIIK